MTDTQKTLEEQREIANATEPPDDWQEGADQKQQDEQKGQEVFDEVLQASSLTREMEEGFQIRDQARETTITITLDEARTYLVKPSAHGEVPSDKDLVLFLKLCQARQANPWTGDIFLVGYDNYKDRKYVNTTWQPIPAYQLYIKRAENHPEYNGMQAGVIVWDREKQESREIEGDVFYKGEVDDNGQHRFVLIGGWSRVYRKDKEHPEYATARLSAYQKTKPVWENGQRTEKVKPTGYWETDPAHQICKCAKVKGLRSAFPNECGQDSTEVEVGFDLNARAAEEEQKPRVRIGEDQKSAADEL